jgi:pimeloyl-ACP methyl ester carboxylesterase
MTAWMRAPLAAAGFLFAFALPAAADSFVLVHGAFQDGRAWAAVEERLEAQGHAVTVVDLPGRNATGPAAQAVTFGDYVATVRAAVEAAPEPVILVGHSFGGMTISRVAEEAPDRVARLVYVAAYVPVSGESMQALAESDHDNGFTAESFVVAADYASASILAADQVGIFLNDGMPDQQAALGPAMLNEPLGPIGTPVELGAAFAGVPKADIRTLRDRAVSPELQTRMIERGGIAEVSDIDAGHLPFVTRPDEVADLLAGLAD